MPFFDKTIKSTNKEIEQWKFGLEIILVAADNRTVPVLLFKASAGMLKPDAFIDWSPLMFYSH